MARKHISQVGPFKKGMSLAADDLQSMLEALHAYNQVPEGFTDVNAFVQASKDKAVPSYITVRSDIDVPPHSVFGIKFGSKHEKPLIATVDKIGVNTIGSHVALCTNDELGIFAGKQGHARFVPFWSPCLLSVAGEVPGVGEPCGVYNDSFGITRAAQGMVCLSEKDAKGCVWVMRTRDPANVFGKISQEVDAFDPCSGQLQQGMIRLYARDAASRLKPIRNPANGNISWTLPIFSAMPMKLKAGSWVSAKSVIGIGLMPDTITTDIVAFKLTSNLVCGGQASAVVIDSCSEEETNQAIIVKDFTAGIRAAKSGARGWAKKIVASSCDDSCTDIYLIVWIEHQAKYVEGYLDSSSQGSVTQYADGRKPPDDVDVSDAQNFFPRKMPGAAFKAFLNPCTDKYLMVECQQITHRFATKASYDFCAGQPAELDAPINLEFSPFNLLPDPPPGTAQNWLNHAGKAGDWLIIAWDHAEQQWFVEDVQHHTASFIVELRYNPLKCAIEAKRQEVQVELCKPPSDWATEIQLFKHTWATGVTQVDDPGDGNGSGTGSTVTCELNLTRASVCGFGSPYPEDPVKILTAQQVDVVTHVIISDTDISELVTEAFVLCIGDTYKVKINDPYVCPTP